LQFSTVCYWYQVEPHAPFPPMLPAAERVPAPEEPFWPEKEHVPTQEQLESRGVKFYMLCGREQGEVIRAEPGFGATVTKGYSYAGWPLPVYHCRADEKELQIDLTVPRGATGLLRIYIIDPDNFQGGREQRLTVGGKTIGEYKGFQRGRWIEVPVTADMSADGKLPIVATNLKRMSNAVISIIEWVDRK
jgi:hypothetical protein